MRKQPGHRQSLVGFFARHFVWAKKRGMINDSPEVLERVRVKEQKDVIAHTLRHSFAKNLVDAGTPLDQVSTLVGHESLDTAKIYLILQ